MRKTILAGLIAATLVPVAAIAQSPITPSERRELRRDRQDIREERRELQDARRFGDRRDIREERRDVRDARKEYREARRDWGRGDWRAYRNQNRNLYRGGSWRSDYRYQAFRPGLRIGNGYYSSRYLIADPWRYRLPRPGFNQRWVRHYNDVILVDTRRGIIIDVIRGIFF